jgi:steroid 5-alpha reductase family enzyme
MSNREGSASRAGSFAYVIAAYVVASAVAAAVAWALRDWRVWEIVAAADAAATVTVFGFSFAFNNSSVYDPYWSVAPMVIAPALARIPSGEGQPTLRQALVVLLVWTWGARLTWNWARGWGGRSHEDWRYVDLRNQTGRGYWAVSLLGLHLMPTLTVFLGCLSLIPALRSGSRAFGLLDIVGLVVAAAAIACESTADRQLRAFRKSQPPPDAILATGLWAKARHPNYLGEISFWWGLSLIGISSDPSAWWIFAGPLWVTALFVFISVPMMDRRMKARRPLYAEHMKRVPALLPRLFSR